MNPAQQFRDYLSRCSEAQFKAMFLSAMLACARKPAYGRMKPALSHIHWQLSQEARRRGLR
jgi:hypothetical protein